MDDQLLRLRKESLAAGLQHDRALKDCADVLIRHSSDQIDATIAAHTSVAEEYGLALERLHDHLEQMEQTNEVVQESNRVVLLMDLLDKEIDGISKRLQLSRPKYPDPTEEID